MAEKGSMRRPETNPQDVQNVYLTAKKNFEKAFADYHQNHFLSKVLDENKTIAAKKTETLAVDNLIKSAMALENMNVGEGVMALLVVAIREQLSIRDRINELEYELLKSIRDVQGISKELGIKDDKSKK